MYRQTTTTIVTLALGLGIGYGAGVVRSERAVRDALATEVSGRLDFDANTLVLAREGDLQQVVASLEELLDTAVVSLGARSHQDERTIRALGIAKVYRRYFPASGELQPALDRALANVPDPDFGHCAPPIRRLATGRAAPPPTAALPRLLQEQ